jgi:hypothetical protein
MLGEQETVTETEGYIKLIYVLFAKWTLHIIVFSKVSMTGKYIIPSKLEVPVSQRLFC